MRKIGTQTPRRARLAQIAIILMAIPLALLYPALPLLSSKIGTEMDVPHLSIPYAIAACLTVAAGHVLLFTIWKIVDFIKTGNFYDKPVPQYMRIARIAVLIGCLMPIGVGLHLLIFERAGGPLMAPFVFAVVNVLIAGLTLLNLLVGLYRDASANVHELADVI